MSGYSTHWRKTICAAIAVHLLAATGFNFALPYLEPKATIADVTQLEWIDAELLSDDVEVIDEEAIPSDAPGTSSTFNAQDLILPEIKIPEPKIESPPPIEIKPRELPKPPPVKPTQETPPKVEEPPKEVVAPKDNQLLGRPPITVMEVYPEQGSGLGYKGIVLIAVTVGKDGKVKAANVVQSSGRMFVDEIAVKAAKQWAFKPALDQKGKPMTCDKIISIDFKKVSGG